VGFPSAKDASYIGEAGPVAEPGLVVSRRFTDAWRATASLGYRVRERTASLALVVDDELVAQLGVGFKLAAMSGPAIDLGASLSVATAAGDALGSFDRNYAELKLGGGFSPMPSVAVILGGGVGMSQGFGTPDWRAFAGARFKFSVGDALSGGGGGDEVDVPKLDIKEAGRISREDVPPPKPTDDDGDGFMSDVDACPSQAETVNGYLDNDGCPDVLPDRDKDGRLDEADQCPDEPEDLDGNADEDGCPDPDDDADGVADREDKCPRVPGVVEAGGCPDPDRDGDTVVDRLDNCPDEPGTPANAGCKAKQLVRLTGDKIEILDAVYFRTDKADIRSKSFKLLDNVGKVLATHPAITVRVEGHTDTDGDDAHNLDSVAAPRRVGGGVPGEEGHRPRAADRPGLRRDPADRRQHHQEGQGGQPPRGVRDHRRQRRRRGRADRAGRAAVATSTSAPTRRRCRTRSGCPGSTGCRRRS
jgi:outer membrane protein OmpA-like peptidoglycan-associated protein